MIATRSFFPLLFPPPLQLTVLDAVLYGMIDKRHERNARDARDRGSPLLKAAAPDADFGRFVDDPACVGAGGC